MLKSLATLLGVFLVSSAWADQSLISKVEIREIPTTGSPLINVQDPCHASDLLNFGYGGYGYPNGLGDIGWGDIINIGAQLWHVVEANKPVVTFKAPVANALPRGLNCWADLDSWQPPAVKTYEATYTNYFNMEVAKFVFRTQYTYGGGHNGTGKYIANATVTPAELNVDWAYTFDAEVQVQSAINIGTADNPVAGLEMNVAWTVKNVLKQEQKSMHFFLRGDGVPVPVN